MILKTSACIEMLYPELPFEERIAAAKKDGYDGFEFWSWDDKDIPALAEAAAAAELPAVTCCIGSKKQENQQSFAAYGLLADEQPAVFVDMVRETIAATRPLCINRLIVTTGNELSSLSRAEQEKNIIACLKAGAAIAAQAGITLLLEPLNILVDHQGYYLSQSAQAFEILSQVNNPHVKLLFDIYHQQITEGNLMDNITKNIAQIGHFHVADVPGRHQPGTGEIRYPFIFEIIEKLGYQGFVGSEYAKI